LARALAVNWSPDDPRRFAIRLDAEAMVYRCKALAALHEKDMIAAASAFRMAQRLMDAADIACTTPSCGLNLCHAMQIFDIE
jgi:hypothetical protein